LGSREAHNKDRADAHGGRTRVRSALTQTHDASPLRKSQTKIGKSVEVAFYGRSID
jgi:hypothetical protein